MTFGRMGRCAGGRRCGGTGRAPQAGRRGGRSGGTAGNGGVEGVAGTEQVVEALLLSLLLLPPVLDPRPR